MVTTSNTGQLLPTKQSQFNGLKGYRLKTHCQTQIATCIFGDLG